MGKYKDENGTTFVGDLLRKVKDVGVDVGPEVLKIAGTLTGVDGLKNLGEALDKDDNISPELKVELMEMAKAYLLDVQNARQMQIEALRQNDIFSKRFNYYLAAFWSIAATTYIFCITFIKIENSRASDTILGFLLGTIIAQIINFFYGSSMGSKEKTEKLITSVKKIIS